MGIFKNLVTIFNYRYNALSSWLIGKKLDEFELRYGNLINQYLLLVFLSFFIHGLCVILIFGPTKDAIFLLISSFYWILCILLKEKRKNKYLIAINFSLLSLSVTYYSSYVGLKGGIFLYYFPLLLALPFFFMKKDYKFTIPVAFFILFCLYFSIISDFKLVRKSTLIQNEENRKRLFLLNATISLVLFSLDLIFIFKKERILYNMLEQLNSKKNTEVKELRDKVRNLADNRVPNESVTRTDMLELMTMARHDDPGFLDKFQQCFPGFFETLRNHTLPDSTLIHSELYLVAMMKLNLNTKQIALYTKSTIKSVDSKKYRLRKKLNIPVDQEIKFWISTLS
ncbi:MAG TPA: hypothetical protein DCQ68_21085 [Chryseobacterium indologenes]|nr:hypothetical protein [Chryseobacterium indologenes]